DNEAVLELNKANLIFNLLFSFLKSINKLTRHVIVRYEASRRHTLYANLVSTRLPRRGLPNGRQTPRNDMVL
ncbi:MAG TPA: hypothetical protein VIJ27_12395, partial [Mucilaginibacter sp.]